MKTLIRSILVLGMLTPVLVVPAQKAGRQSELMPLNRLVGKYPYQTKLFARDPLARRLHRLLESDYRKLIQNMQVSGPLQKEGSILFVTGNKTHDGGENDACVLIDPKQDVINVILDIDKHLHTYRERKTTLPLPADAKNWLDNIKSFH